MHEKCIKKVSVKFCIPKQGCSWARTSMAFSVLCHKTKNLLKVSISALSNDSKIGGAPQRLKC